MEIYSAPGGVSSDGLPTSSVPSDVTPLDEALFADLGKILNAANPFSGVNGLGPVGLAAWRKRRRSR